MRRQRDRFYCFICLFIMVLAHSGLSSAAIRSAIFVDIARVEAEQKGWQNTWAAGLGATFPVTRNFLFFLNFSRWRFDVSPRDPRLLAGQLTLSPLNSGIYFVLLPRSFVSPVLSIGAGYFFAQYRPAKEGWVAIPEIIRLSKKVEGNFSWELGAGISVRLSRRLNLWFQAERYRSVLKIETTVVDLNFGTIRTRENFRFSPTLYRLGFQLNL